MLGLLAAALLLVILIVIIWYIAAGRLPKPGEGPLPGPTKPDTQSAACPDVQFVAIPGTWESSPNDDPRNPTAVPAALLNNVTVPLNEQFPDSRVDVYTVPYVAQFSNPIAFPPDGQQSYNNSRTAGTHATTDVLAGMHANCPLTSFVIVGFSQGAVIAGDIAAQIGADKGPVPADQVLGVTLIADGRRVPDQAVAVGANPPGVGAEVALKGLKVPGITMTGPRPDGFGSLTDRVNNICAPGDLICAAPPAALSPVNIPGSLASLASSAGNPVHAQYNTFVVDGSGITATEWTAGWASELINGAPQPAHE
ncbi:cutinase family protein [Aldersonia kunmingensis]|uniref:cutinase family protein n=1 Tax=Aldersonia kunmingensis TaxID=408066 RepID=UPI000A952889|nr:cutinase family protein [Aldersonia kunmingensis]